MIGNLIASLVLAVWLVAVCVYIYRQKKAAKESGNPICIGCPGAAGCGGRCHSRKAAAAGAEA